MATEVFNFLTTGGVPYTVAFTTITAATSNGWAMSQPSVYNSDNESIGFVISNRSGTGFTITTESDARCEMICTTLPTDTILGSEVFNFPTLANTPHVVTFQTINTTDGNGWAMSTPSVYNTYGELVGFVISDRTGTGFTVTTEADARFEAICTALVPNETVYPPAVVYVPPDISGREGYIKIPHLNPIRFFSDVTEDFFYNQLKDWEYRRGFIQKYQFGDVPGLQFIAPYTERLGGARIELLDRDQTYVMRWNLYLEDEIEVSGGYVYRWMNAFPTTVSEGVYYLKVYLPGYGGVTMHYLSEPIYLKSKHEETIEIYYKHDQNDFDCLFVSPTRSYYRWFMLRIECGVKQDGFLPGGNYTMFQDMDLSPVLLNATPQDVYRFTFGDNIGIPNYMAGKINRLLCLCDVTIDGIYYERKEGATLEAQQRDPLYTLGTWTMDLVLKENLFSQIYDGTHPLTLLFTADNNTITADNNLLTADLNYYTP